MFDDCGRCGSAEHNKSARKFRVSGKIQHCNELVQERCTKVDGVQIHFRPARNEQVCRDVSSGLPVVKSILWDITLALICYSGSEPKWVVLR